MKEVSAPSPSCTVLPCNWRAAQNGVCALGPATKKLSDDTCDLGGGGAVPRSEMEVKALLRGFLRKEEVGL